LELPFMAKENRSSADAEDGDEKQEAKPKSSGSMKKIILIVVGALALVATSVGATWFATSLMQTDAPIAKKKTTKSKKAVKAETEEAEAAAKDEAEEKDAKEGSEKEAETAEEGDEDKAAKGKTAAYLDFEQPFIVNFQDEQQLRYLQVGVAVMAHDPGMTATVKQHMPVIRNNLVMLFSSQTRQSIASREGKEKVRAEAQAEVQKILTDQTGKPVIEQLYFTSFVMQ
jgi:flagellar FliL protein